MWRNGRYVLFFFSGASALIYELIWQRQLHLLFGVSTLAVSAARRPETLRSMRSTVWRLRCAGTRQARFECVGLTSRLPQSGKRAGDELLHPSHGRASIRASHAGEDSHRGAGWAAKLGEVDAL